MRKDRKAGSGYLFGPPDHTVAAKLGLAAAGTISLRFVVAFAGFAAILLAAYYFPYAEGGAVRRVLDSYLKGYAALAGFLLRPFEPHLVIVGQDIIGRYSLRIVKTCDAMDVNILLTSAILAWPTSIWKRLLGVLAGLTTIAMVNTLRICSLYFIGVYAPGHFELFHIELWPIAIVVIVVALFMTFIEVTRRHELA